MMKRKLMVVLFGALAMATAPMIGCGGTDDPSDNNQENNTEPNNTEPNNTEPNNTEPNNTEPNNTEPNNTEPNNTEPNNTEPNNGEPVDCEVNETFYGQIGTGEDQDGGVPVSEPLTESTGLQDVWDAIEDAVEGDISDAEDEVDVDLSDAPISVEGAVVTATIFRGFYVADGDTALFVDNRTANDALEVDNDDVRVGQKVSFEVTGAGTFFADPQITGLVDWTVDEEDVDVPVHDITDEPFDLDEQMYRNVRTSVLLPTSEDDTFTCAGDVCYNATYGNEQQFDIVMKMGEGSFWELGECRTFVGPLLTFPGYYSSNPTPQLDEINWSWTGFPAF